MKIAIISDVHDNQTRLDEALCFCKKEEIDTCICCGDISSLDIVNQLSNQFKLVYIALGNMDYKLRNQIELFPENIEASEDILETSIEGLKIAAVHHDYKAKELAKKNKFDYVFYGHTHTPWEKKIGKTIMLNPGEVSGQFGKASFAILDTKKKKTSLIILT